VRVLFVLAVLLLGAYLFGVFDPSFSREVGRPPNEVMASLADLDIREQPGSPGTDPSASGGVLPVFRLERGPDTMTWVVMSGDQVATRMIAKFTPEDQGRKTLVSASVERGDAPDDFVSPAFRSKGITMGLFAMALEAELNELTLPASDPEKCKELFAKLGEERPTEDALHQDDLKDAMGDMAIATMRLQAQEAELRRRGCNTNPDPAFHSVQSKMR